MAKNENVIDGVDFKIIANDALNAAKLVINNNQTWDELEAILKNLVDGLKEDVKIITKKKFAGEFNENDAKLFMQDQMLVARIRIRSIVIISAQVFENIWNAIATVFSKAINTALGWSVL